MYNPFRPAFSATTSNSPPIIDHHTHSSSFIVLNHNIKQRRIPGMLL